MLGWIAFVALALVSATSAAGGVSARRDANVSYKAYFRNVQPQQLDSSFTSSFDKAVPLEELDQSTLPQWDAGHVEIAFLRVRDHRFLYSMTDTQFLRRSSWLYPDDGCYARAALAKKNMQEWLFPPVKKLFAYGNLVVNTDNAPGGSVTWWYHVVPVMAVGDQAFVVDPAIEPQRALTIQEWSERMGGDQASIKFAVCNGNSYTPMDSCDEPSDTAEASAHEEQVAFLGLEWDRLESLSRDPRSELGDNPPWKYTGAPIH